MSPVNIISLMKTNWFRTAVAASAIVMTIPVYGQDFKAPKDSTSNWAKHWKYTLDAGINVNQAAFSESWKGGGVNNVAFGAYLFGSLDYNKDKWTWNNTLKTQYGQILTFNRNANNKQVGNLRKAQDYFDLVSKADYKISKMWRAFGQVNFLTQFDKGYDYRGVDPGGKDIRARLSNFMAPGYLTESVGIEFKPVDWFYVNVGLIALRQTFVIDTTLYNEVPANYGVEIGKRVNNQIGFSLETAIDKNVHKNVNLKFKYRAFKDYTDPNRLLGNGQENLSGQMVHRIDALISAKITKYIVTSLGAIVLYDATQDKRVQWSQGLALGIAYKIYGNTPKK